MTSKVYVKELPLGTECESRLLPHLPCRMAVQYIAVIDIPALFTITKFLISAKAELYVVVTTANAKINAQIILAIALPSKPIYL